jgi:SAM-dependent methyltransferase
MLSEPHLQVEDGQIDAAALRARVQEKLSRARAVAPPTATSSGSGRSASAGFQDVDRALGQAAERWAVGTQVPPMHKLRGVFRTFATPAARALLRAAQLITRDQRDFNAAVLQVLQQLRGLLPAQLDETRRALSSELDAIRAAIGESVSLEELERERAAREAGLETLVAENEALRGLLEAQARTLEGLRGEVRQSNDRLREEQARREEVQRGLVLQERRLTVLIEEARRRLPGPLEPSQAEVFATEGRKMRERLYPAFEDAFRGSPAEIQGRLEAYVPVLREALAGEPNRTIVDLGCGRGEFLDLLAKRGLEALGVELNEEMVDRSRARGLKVESGDLVSYLRALPDASLGAVTAIHVIEHLPLEAILSVFEECARVLKPGGIAIFETPNPENVLVGACNFYIDPTHIRPLHPSTMRFLAEARGLTRVRVEYFRPMTVPDLGSPQLSAWLRAQLFGPQDYAVIGYRPVERS